MNRRRRPPLAASRNRPRAFAAIFIFAAVFFLILRPASAEDVTLIGPNEAHACWTCAPPPAEKASYLRKKFSKKRNQT